MASRQLLQRQEITRFLYIKKKKNTQQNKCITEHGFFNEVRLNIFYISDHQSENIGMTCIMPGATLPDHMPVITYIE